MYCRWIAVAGLLGLLAGLPLDAQDKAGVEVVRRFDGHTDAVYAVAFSPDGKFIATASFDNTVKLWDVATGKEIKTYAGALGHTKQVLTIAFSDDGSQLVSGSGDNSVKIWDVPVSTPLRTLPTADAVQSVALSPDGLKLAIGGKDGSLKLVAPADFKEVAKFDKGHQGAITALAFSGNNQMLASVGADRTLRYWNVANGQLLGTVGAHTAGINGVVVNPNNTAAYTVSDDGTLKLWTLPPAPSKTLPGHGAPIRTLAVSADNANFYTGGDDRTVRHFNIAAAKEVRTLSGPQAGVTSVAAHPANAFIAAGAQDGRVVLWNNADGKVLTNWLAHNGPVTSVQVQPQGQQLMTAGSDGLVKFWALPTVPPRVMTHPDAVLAAVSSADGKKLFTGSSDKLVRIWDTSKQVLEKQFMGHTAAVTVVAVSPNLQILASGSADHTIRVWNQATAKETDVLLAHTAPLTALGINAAGSQMLSASEDGSVKSWSLPLVAPKQFMHADAITTLLLTPDGGKVLTAANDKIVRLWNLTTGAKEKDYAGATMPIAALAISGNGATIAAVSSDKTLTLWNTADAKVLHKVSLPALAQAVAFAVDGQSVLVGLADSSIKQIKTADAKDIKTLPAQHKGAINALVVSPKGDLLYSASADKTIQTWTLPEGTPKAKFDHSAPIQAMALSKDGSRLAAVAGKSVKLWASDGKELNSWTLPADARSIAFAPDHARLLVACVDKVARVYDLDGKLLELLPHDGAVQGAAFADGKRIVTGGADKLARLWTSSLLWQRSHQGPVRQAVFTPKGDQVISAGDDKTIKIWNAADGKEVKSLANDMPITHLSLSADATKIATADVGTQVKLWTIADGKFNTIAPSKAVHGLALSPNGQRLAMALAERPNHVIHIRDLGLARDVQVFTDHAAALHALRFLGDGRTLVTASADKTARLLDVGATSVLAAHPSGPTFAQYHNSGTQVITAGADKAVKLWDLAKANVVKSFGPVADPIKALTFSKDFARIGVATGKAVKVWATADGKELANLPHGATVLSLAFNPEGTRIITGADDKQSRLWDLATGKELQFFAADDAVAAVAHLPNNVVLHSAGKITRLDNASIARAIAADVGPVNGLALTPANTHVLTAGADKIVKLWNLANGAKEREFSGATAALRSVAIAKNSQLVAAGGADQTVRVYQFADGKEVGSVKSAGDIRRLAFTPNNLALVAAAGKSLQAWSVPFTTGQPLAKEFLRPQQSFTPADTPVDLALAVDNATIYSAGPSNAVQVWKLASAVPTRSFNFGSTVDAVAFQPKGGLVAATGHDGKVRIYDLVKNASVKEFNAHIREVQKNMTPQPIYSLTYSADGKQLLTSSYDNSLKLWDAAAGTLIREFKPYKEKEFERGHQEPVYAAAFSPDGKFIASGSSGLERTIKIWNVADGNVVRDLINPAFPTTPGFPPPSHPGAVFNLRFTRDGKHLISVGDAAGNKGFLGIWDWQAGKLLASDTLPLGVFYGLALAPDEKSVAVSAGNRDRKNASPTFNAAYLIKLPQMK